VHNTIKHYDALLVHVPKPNEYYPILGTYELINIIPYGLFSIAAHAQQNGHRVGIVHLGIEQELDPEFSLARFVKDKGALTVGFSLHWHYQAAAVIDQIALLKQKLPATRIVLGGITASYFAKSIVEQFPVDGVCQGEGERTFSKILDQAVGAPLDGIPNLVYPGPNGVVASAERHEPDAEELAGYHYFDAELLVHPEQYLRFCHTPWVRPKGLIKAAYGRGLIRDEKLFTLPTFRGCPYNCSYCGGTRNAYSRFMNRGNFAVIDAKPLILALKNAATAGFRSLLFEYINFPEAEKQVLEIISALSGLPEFYNLIIECRNIPSSRFVTSVGKLVKQGRKVRFNLSADVANDIIRKLHNKPQVSDGKLFDTIELCRMNHVDVEVFFTAGFSRISPNSTKQLREKCEQFIKKGAVAVRVQSGIIEPGSMIYEAPDHFGMERTVNGLGDYIEMHRSKTFPPDLGFTLAGVSPRLHNKQTQQMLCHEFCLINKRFRVEKGKKAGTFSGKLFPVACKILQSMQGLIRR